MPDDERDAVLRTLDLLISSLTKGPARRRPTPDRRVAAVLAVAASRAPESVPPCCYQRVVADAPRDRSEVRLIRRSCARRPEAFRRGEFADPASIHGEEMPGLAALQTGSKRIEVRSRYLSEGAEITYRTSDSLLAAAIGDWFDAQLNDHGTDAIRGEHSCSEHSTHSAHEH